MHKEKCHRAKGIGKKAVQVQEGTKEREKRVKGKVGERTKMGEDLIFRGCEAERRGKHEGQGEFKRGKNPGGGGKGGESDSLVF